MSVSNVSASAAYSYLQSLLQQQSSSGIGTTDPITSLLDAFYPNGTGSGSSSTADPISSVPSSGSSGPQYAPDTLGTMISLQSQQPWNQDLASRVQSIFTQLDTNHDGLISQSEFDSAFGPNADMSKVNTLFSALDANGDGSISQSELTSAAQASQAQHHHHHHHMGGGSGGATDPLAMLMSATQGANSSTTSNPDGSTTTTITYADGSTVTMTTPTSSNQSANNNTGSQGSTDNLLEQLIQLQSQLLAQSANTLVSTLPV